MSSQTDPFREIVKSNIHLYRAAQESHMQHTEKITKDYIQWKTENEIYVRAAKAFSMSENCNLKEIGIHDDTPLKKSFDNPSA